MQQQVPLTVHRPQSYRLQDEAPFLKTSYPGLRFFSFAGFPPYRFLRAFVSEAEPPPQAVSAKTRAAVCC